MSLETEIKKVHAAISQLTDAVVVLSQSMAGAVPTQQGQQQQQQDTPPQQQQDTPPQQQQQNNMVMDVAAMNARLGEIAIQMGDNGAAIYGVMQKYGAQKVINEIAPDRLAAFMADVELMAGQAA